MQRYST